MVYGIIAAGEGSRLAQEGVKWPKPLVRLNGTTLIDRLISVFINNGATAIYVIVNEEMKDVQEYLKKKELPVPFHLLVKSTPSSMHSFYELSRLIESDRICLTTVDTIFREEEFGDYIKTFSEDNDSDGLMAVTDYIDDEKPLYVVTDEELNILDFSDNDDNYRYISGGIYCLRQNSFRILEKCISSGISRMRNFQRQLIREGLNLKAYPFKKIIDVDHAEDIQKAEEFITNKSQ